MTNLTLWMARWNIVFSFLLRLLERKENNVCPCGWLHRNSLRRGKKARERERQRKKIREDLSKETIRLHPYSYKKQNWCSTASVFSMLIQFSATSGSSDDRETSDRQCYCYTQVSAHMHRPLTIEYTPRKEWKSPVHYFDHSSRPWRMTSLPAPFVFWHAFQFDTTLFRYVCEWQRQSSETLLEAIFVLSHVLKHLAVHFLSFI